MKCKTCGKNADSEYCFQHKPRKPLAQTSGFKAMVQKVMDAVDTRAMRLLFIRIWNIRPHNSEVSGERLSSPPSSGYFHHILEKEKYDEAKFDEENIILLTLDEHTNVGNDCFRYSKINERRKYLQKKYDL